MNEKRESVWVPLVLTVFVIGAIAVGAVFLAKSYDLPGYVFSKIRGTDGRAPEVGVKDRPIARGPDATIDASRMEALRQLLEEERFAELNRALAAYQEAFEGDPASDIALYDAYQSFYVTAPLYGILLNQWIDAHPGEYQPYLAAAHFYYAKGWQSRGFKWRRETSDEQIQGMQRNFQAAEDKLASALEINPDLMLAYNILIGIHNAGGRDRAERQTIEKALGLFPASYIIRSTAAWANQPRWGGNYREMWRIAKEAEAYAEDVPVLTSLYGAIFCDQARVAERNEDYDKALELYDRAIQFGDRDYFYEERASFYLYELEDTERALEDINYAILLRPTKCDNYRMRARIHFAREAYEAALDDLEMIDMVRPGDPSTIRWCQRAARKLNQKGHKRFKADLKGAQQFYQVALSFDAENIETHYWHGVANYRLKRYEEALADFKTCIDLDPGYFEAYRMLDYTLAKDRQWDTIIEYWNAFLELEPDHAEAYLERSGTHYHNKNMKQAMADLQKACDLGNQKACQQYAKRQ